MKIEILLTPLMLFASAIILFGQNIPPAPADKSVVYFVRVNSAGALVNFTFFDNDQIIGKFNGRNYMRYECEPGEHLFWARSENKHFMLANIEAGKVYFVEAVPQVGAIKAGVKLVPLHAQVEAKRMKKVYKVMDRSAPLEFSKEYLEMEQASMAEVIYRGKTRYEATREDVENAPRLKPDWHFVIPEVVPIGD